MRGTFDVVASRDLESEATLHSRRRRAVRSPSARLIALCAAAVATALATVAAAQSSPARALASPQMADIARASAAIPDSMASGSRANLSVPATAWGGSYRTPAGESVRIFASSAYPVDQSVGQRWADFLGSLVHGTELSSVTVFFAPSSQVERLCGQDTVACYSAADKLLVAPGEDPSSDLSAEAVVTHEYGHHVAANRDNAPWSALEYGTKRWASSIQVCSRARKGELAPGAENPVEYDVNPGEGFAEAYRVLNERKAGAAETPWRIVSDVLYPSTAALNALELDVTSPWQTPTTTTKSGRLTRAARSRTFTVPTPLDGTLRATVRSTARVRLSLDVFAGATRVARGVAGGAVTRTTTICGQRSYRIRVTALKGTGAFSLAVSKP